MSKFSSTHQPDYSERPTRGPNKKLAMLNAIEKRFPGGSQEFCEEILSVGLTGGPEGSPVPQLLTECLKRIEPPLKPQGTLISIYMPEDATKAQQAEIILMAVFNGSISSDTGQMLIGMIKDTLAITESTELVKRLEALEEALEKANSN